MESFCPLHIDLKGRECLVFGGGAVAERKVKVMLAYLAKVTVVSPDLTSTLSDLVDSKTINYLADIYRPAYLKDRFMVICATDSEDINRKAAEDCIEQGILVNSVSEPDKCTFFLPALLKKGPLSIAVSTAGRSPSLSCRIRDKLDSFFGPEYEDYINFLGEVRSQVIERIADKKSRRAVFEYLAGDEFFSAFKVSSRHEIEKIVERIVAEKESGSGHNTTGEDSR